MVVRFTPMGACLFLGLPMHLIAVNYYESAHPFLIRIGAEITRVGEKSAATAIRICC